MTCVMPCAVCFAICMQAVLMAHSVCKHMHLTPLTQGAKLIQGAKWTGSWWKMDCVAFIALLLHREGKLSCA